MFPGRHLGRCPEARFSVICSLRLSVAFMSCAAVGMVTSPVDRRLDEVVSRWGKQTWSRDNIMTNTYVIGHHKIAFCVPEKVAHAHTRARARAHTHVYTRARMCTHIHTHNKKITYVLCSVMNSIQHILYAPVLKPLIYIL